VRFASARAAVITATVMLTAMAMTSCGGSSDRTRPLAPTASAAPQTPVSSPEARYVDARYGFSFSYPASWPEARVQQGLGLTPRDVYVSNEDAPSPLEMQLDSVLISVRVIANPDRVSADDWAVRFPAGSARESTTLTVAGEPAVRQVVDNTTGPREMSYEVVTYVRHNDLMYIIIGLTLTEQARSEHMADYETVVSSLRFN